MDKESSILSWIKNRILLIFSRFKKNAEAGFGEDKEQLIDRKEEKSSEREEEVPTSFSEVLRKWLEFDEKMEKFEVMIEKGRNEILKDRKDISNKIIEGISGLKDEYDKRLNDLKRSIEKDYDKRFIDLKRSIIEELKKKNGEGAVSDFVPSELEEIGDFVKIARLNSQRGKIEEITKILDDISINKLEKIKLTIGIAALLSEEGTEIIKPPPQLKEDLQLDKLLERVVGDVSTLKRVVGDVTKKHFEQLTKIPLLYNKGIALLKEGAYGDAYKYFEEIVTINPNLKGAQLNKGVALGRLGEIEREIGCYVDALSIDQKYKKALHNKKIAEKEKKRKKHNAVSIKNEL